MSLPMINGLFAADPGNRRRKLVKTADEFDRSIAAGTGEDIHMLKCATYSESVIPPLPTSSISRSFQPPLTEYDEIVACMDIICVTEQSYPPEFGLSSWISVERHGHTTNGRREPTRGAGAAYTGQVEYPVLK